MTKKKRKKTQITNGKNESGDIPTNFTEIKIDYKKSIMNNGMPTNWIT